MAHTAQDILDNFSLTYAGVPLAMQLILLNEVDIEITRAFGVRKKLLNIPIIAGQSAYDFDPNAVWIEKTRYVDQPNLTLQGLGGWELKETNVDEMDTSDVDWRANPNGTPCAVMITADETGGQIELDWPAIATTLLVANATFATPIVITSDAAHNLSDSDRVDLVDVLGNTNANGHFYAQETGYGATTFALFYDAELTMPVPGNAIWSGGGLISCAGSPYLQVFTRWHVDLTQDSDMPNLPLYVRLYANGMKFYYATDRVLKDVPAYQALYKDQIANQMEILQKRGGRKPFRIRTVGVRTAYASRSCRPSFGPSQRGL